MTAYQEYARTQAWWLNSYGQFCCQACDPPKWISVHNRFRHWKLVHKPKVKVKKK